jgi:hypothetical protein
MRPGPQLRMHDCLLRREIVGGKIVRQPEIRRGDRSTRFRLFGQHDTPFETVLGGICDLNVHRRYPLLRIARR